jgi:alpha-beta hydrolase superfamily lysophospholipase
MEPVKLTAKDGYKLSLSVFKTASARGYIQLIHGMEEHKERYFAFAEKLRQMGYTVIVSDLRGHGKDAECLGFFKEKDGYQYLLSDQVQITEYIKERFGVERVYVFAHSMGTIIARNLLQEHSHSYEKVVLSGYPNHPGEKKIRLGLFLTDMFCRLRGPRFFSKMIERSGVGVFNNAIKDSKTDYDWICTNEAVIQEYIQDPYCGHGFTVSAFHDLMMLTDGMAQVERYHDVNSELPILMLRGENDPSTGFDEGAKESIETLKKAGFSNIRTITYENMRHEIINEDEKERVYADVIAFFREPPVTVQS